MMTGSLYILIVLLMVGLLAYRFRKNKLVFYAIIILTVIGLVAYVVMLNQALNTM